MCVFDLCTNSCTGKLNEQYKISVGYFLFIYLHKTNETNIYLN